MDSFLIAGIGASAGGIQALQTFFEAAPAGAGIAYVVILHLSPDYDSQLAQVLQRATAMPVAQVTEKTYLRPDHVYVIPPDRHLEMEDGYIVVTPNTELAERRAPVDIFFRSLAESHDSRAVGVILSGTGANGSMGLKRIKERGGAVFVQNPREAEFSEMARNAIATDLVDDVLNAADIPARIIAYRDSLSTVHIPEAPKDRKDAGQQALRAVLAELRLRTGHDFANYKRPTLLRRIERRIHVRDLPDLAAYAAFISQHPEETHALLKDLLISVTNFFRDKLPFEELEKTILPKLLEGKNAGGQLRIWVAGCATGEEAYSIAMICAELTLGIVDAPRVQIFATDIDEAAIATARDGFYTLNDAADVPQEWLARYFTKEGDGYRVRRELRETILFANHNFLKDSPFSRIDLVSCRNVLIYLNRTAQERVFETFHFALKAGGFLLLGTSESIDGTNSLFSAYSREQHIWQSRQVVSKNIIVPEGIPRMELPPLPAKALSQPRPQERISFGELHQQMVELYAPPSLIVNEDFDIVHTSEHAARYLAFVAGEPTQNLLKLVREELRTELRSALYAAAQQRAGVSAMGLRMQTDNHTETLNIHVRPIPEGNNTAASGYMLVVFEPVPAEGGEAPILLTTDEPASRHLEAEVSRLKTQLRASNEQHEFAAEELKAGNEELQAMNEELRSATEELETSKEELQSINEELSTVNQELKVKVEEASMTSNNLRNIINSTDIGTIILDRSFRVAMFTPAARAIFNLIPADYGRPLSDITNRLVEDSLVADAEQVLQTLHSLERELETTDGLTYLTRLSPYRTEDDHIQGVVISLVDITERRRTESALRQSEEWRKLILQSAEDYAIFTLDLERRVNSWNIGAQQMFGYRDEEITGQIGDIVFTPEDREQGAPQSEAETAIREGRAANERWHLRKDGARFWGSGLTHPLRDESGRPIGFVKIMRDLTEQKQVQESKHFLAAIVESSEDSVFAVDFNGNITSWNKAAEWLYGYPAKEAIGKPMAMLGLPEDLQPVLSKVDDIRQHKTVQRFDAVRIRKGGELIELEIMMSPVKNNAGDVIGVSTIARNITGRKRAEEAVRMSEEKYRTLFDTMAEGFTICSAIRDAAGQVADLRYLEVNHALEQHTGLNMQAVTGKKLSEVLPPADMERWMPIYAQVIASGVPVAFEEYAQALRRWLSVSVYSRKDDELAIFYRDITERKQQEEQQTFLLQLSDILQRLAQPNDLKAAAMRLLGEHLGVSRAQYHEVDSTGEYYDADGTGYANGLPLLDLKYRIDDFGTFVGEDFKAGRPFRSDDLTVDPRPTEEERTAYGLYQIRAGAGVPLIRGGQLVAILAVHDVHVHHWTDLEMELIRETAERIWTAVERVYAEEALRESEEKFRMLFTSMDEGCAVVEVLADEHGRWNDVLFLDANPAFVKQTGMDHPVGHRASALPGTPNPHWARVFGRVADTGEPVRLEEREPALGRVFDLYCFRLNDGAGNRVAVLLNDITERKKAEDAIRKSQQRFESIANLVPDLLWESEPDGATNWYNQRWLEYTGQPLEEAIGWGWAHAIHPEDREGSAQRYGEAVKTGQPLRQEHRIRRNDGAYRWFVVRAIPLKDENGRVVKMYGTASDIHDQRVLLETLRQSEERLQKAISIETIGVLFFSLNGKIAHVNKAAVRMFGYNSEELLALANWEVLTDPDFSGITAQTKADLATRGETQPYERRMVRKDGSHWWGLFAPTRLSGEGQDAECVAFIIDITESKHAAEALRESETRLRRLSDAVPQVIWTNDAAGVANYFNQRWYEYTGLSYKQSHGLGWQAIVHPDDAPGSRERWQQALSNGISFDTEFRLRGADGKYRWFIVRNVPLKDTAGRPAGWFGSATDIHDLKMAEEDLHKSRERLRVTMESATDYAIISTDVDGRIEGWNKGAEHIFGYSEAEVLGQHADLIFTPEDRAAGVPQKELQKALGEGRAEDERWHIRRDGSRFYMSGVTSPIYDGTLTGYVKVARDMTGPKAAEEQLRVSEERYRVALQSADMAAWDWNVTEDSIRWNDQHFLLLGLEPEDRLQHAGYFLQFVHPDDLPLISKELTRAVEETGHYRAEAFRIIRADGQVRWMSGYGRSVEWRDSKCARMVGVMFDITKRKELERQKDEFIGIASHELRTPVTAIKAYGEILQEIFAETGDADSIELMQKMDVQLDRLSSLIYSLLDATRISEGKLALEKTSFGIDDLIMDTAEVMRPIAGSHRIDLALDAAVAISADRERIRQVLINLMSNALKYSPGAECITVQSTAADGQLRVCVQDYGIGISEEGQQRVFDRFFRDAQASTYSGLGLGLFISASIIRQHGGRIWVKSRKGEGALFCFVLPLGAA